MDMVTPHVKKNQLFFGSLFFRVELTLQLVYFIQSVS